MRKLEQVQDRVLTDRFYTWEDALQEYAEFYARKCLELAGEKLSSMMEKQEETFGWRKGDFEEIDVDEITFLTLPNHDD